VGDTKERLLAASEALFQRQGLAATGIKQILAEAEAPYSSLYHHFPGGKDALAAAAIRNAGRRYQQLVEEVWDPSPDVLTAVASVFEGAAATLEETDFAVACPIATVALEVAGTNDQLRRTTAEVFDDWIDSATGRLVAGGISEERARSLALSIIALLEGAFLLSQSQRTIEPVVAAGQAASSLVREVLGASAQGPDIPMDGHV
jgi:AcrR family transcriptional regulator